MPETDDTTQTEFTWHPDYAGQSFDAVRRTLTDDIARDQQLYHHALEDAEKQEHDAFNSLRELDRRWSVYDFGWFDQRPEVLAQRILAFEQARESKHALFDWQTWRTDMSDSEPMLEEKRDWRENLSDQQRRQLASALSIFILLLLLFVCVGLYMLAR